MNLIYTYWTNNGVNISCGFTYPQMFFDCANLSLKRAKSQLFDNIIIYTDNVGRDILYKNVSESKKGVCFVIVDYASYNFDTRYWNFPKMISYNLQNEPFLHIDLDVLLEYDFYTTIGENIASDVITECMREYKMELPYFRYCMFKGYKPQRLICSGLIGGSNLDVFKENFIVAQKSCKPTMFNVSFFDLVAIEEFSFSMLCLKKGLDVYGLEKDSYLHFQGTNKGIRYGSIIDSLVKKEIKKVRI